jgi:hypothetical protein
MVSLLITPVATGIFGPYVNVDPSMTATVLPMAENTCPPTMTKFDERGVGGATVVWSNITPPDPKVRV